MQQTILQCAFKNSFQYFGHLYKIISQNVKDFTGQSNNSIILDYKLTSFLSQQ